MPLKPKASPLKVKRDPGDGSWRYSFRGGGVVSTGHAGPSSYDEAEAFFNAFTSIYGYEPEDSDYPEGALEAHDAKGPSE